MPKVQVPDSFADAGMFIHTLRDLRDRAIRAGAGEKHLFADPLKFRAIVLTLFVDLTIAAEGESVIAQEFYESVRHLVVGGPLEAVPLKSVSQAEFVRRMRRILKGELPQLSRATREGVDDDDRRDDREEEEGHDGGDAVQAGAQEVRRVRVRRV